jgi:hypothetical protein
MIETGIKSLIDKFRKILHARMRGQTEQARTLFNGFNIEDFPIIPEFRMSHENRLQEMQENCLLIGQSAVFQRHGGTRRAYHRNTKQDADHYTSHGGRIR